MNLISVCTLVRQLEDLHETGWSSVLTNQATRVQVECKVHQTAWSRSAQMAVGHAEIKVQDFSWQGQGHSSMRDD